MTNASFRAPALCACVLLAGAVAPVWGDPAEPFKTYQGWRDAPVQDWRAANDRVGEVGGWRTYLREAQPDGGANHAHGSAPVQPQMPSDAGHGGQPHPHHGH